MGNAGYHHFLSVEYPTSIKADVDVDGGYVGNPFDTGGHKSPNIIHMYNVAECATGCGATFTFQRNVKTLKTTYECKKSFRSEFGTNFSFGYTEDVLAQGENVEKLKSSGYSTLGINLKITDEEAKTYFVATEYKVDDSSATSKAFIYHCYANYDWIQFEWLRNDLHMTPGDDLLFEYQTKTYLKVHPNYCQGDAGPHIGYELSKNYVQSHESKLRVLHENGRHKASIQIAFDEKYMKDGVYIGSPK